MKRLLSAMVLVAGFLGMAQQAHAGGGNIGLGLVGEDPSGLTLKLGLGEKQALDFRLGLGFRFDNAFLFQGNYLIDLFDVASNGNFKLPFYIGVGGTLFVFNNNGNGNGGIGVTARVPIGLDMELNAVPVDIFFEVAPQLRLIPEIDVDIDGAIGVRYFF